jgi:carbohydrate-selective porin OprB
VNSRVAWIEMLQNLEGQSPVAVQNSEYVAETYYTYRPTSGLEFRPSLQYVIQRRNDAEQERPNIWPKDGGSIVSMLPLWANWL